MPIARHANPPADRTATAPYNFVPLPEEVLLADAVLPDDNGKKLWERHDHHVPGTFSGWIDLKITTLTPLFVRGPRRKSNRQWDDRDARLRPEPAADDQGRAMIPGSSLRGMIRMLYEIFTFGKVQPVSHESLFYRKFEHDPGTVLHAGFVTRNGTVWQIKPCKYLSVHHDLLNPDFYYDARPNAALRNAVHLQPCHFISSDGENADTCDLLSRNPGLVANGTVVQTGSAGNQKDHEFIFHAPEARRVTIPQAVLDCFNSDDQITAWQADNFPERPGRRKSGFLGEGDAVFYLQSRALEDEKNNPDGLDFLGRAGLFRLPYDLSPRDLLPPGHDADEIDLPEALFGRVREKSKVTPAIKGRVFVEDAVSPAQWTALAAAGERKTTLLSPHASCYPHYLAQQSSRRNALNTFLNKDVANGGATLRGSKLFWHRATGDNMPPEVLPNRNNNLTATESLLTPLWVTPEHAFAGRVRFQNLAPAELGALLHCLDLPEGCAHKVGMAKPHGLGSIKIEATLHVVDAKKRYGSWSDSGAAEMDAADFRNTFSDIILKKVAPDERKTTEQGLRSIARLDALYTLLTIPGPLRDTQQMALSAFRDKKVLPTPHKVAGRDVVDETPPHDAAQRQEAAAPARSARHGSRRPDPAPVAVQPRIFRGAEPTQGTPPQQEGKPLAENQDRIGVLHKVGDGWACSILNDPDNRPRTPVFELDAKKIPVDTNDGQKAWFRIRLCTKNSFRPIFDRIADSGDNATAE